MTLEVWRRERYCTLRRGGRRCVRGGSSPSRRAAPFWFCPPGGTIAAKATLWVKHFGSAKVSPRGPDGHQTLLKTLAAFGATPPKLACSLCSLLGVSALPRRVVRRTTICIGVASAAEPQHTPYVRAERARVDHTAPTLHPRTRGVHTERLHSHTSDPCIPARPLTVTRPHADTP